MLAVTTSPESAEVSETVRLNADVEVPRTFTETLMTKLEGEGRYARTVVAVQLDEDGTPRLTDFRFTPPRDGLRADELRRPDLAGLLSWAYRQQVAKALMRSSARDLVSIEGGQLSVDEDEMQAIYERARDVIPRGPHKVTDEFLSQVVEQYLAGGLDKVTEENDTSQRTARRWLAEAKTRGLR